MARLEPAARGEYRILIVDDEQDILDSLKDLLEASLDNVEVLIAPSGAKALAILGEQKVDLIVSDYKMPGMDGLQFLEKANELAPNVPRLMITAFPDLDLAMKAINEARISNFFTKPLDPEETVRIIDDTLQKHHKKGLREQSFSRAMDLMRRQKKADAPEEAVDD